MTTSKKFDLININPRKGLSVNVRKTYNVKNWHAIGESVNVRKRKKKEVTNKELAKFEQKWTKKNKTKKKKSKRKVANKSKNEVDYLAADAEFLEKLKKVQQKRTNSYKTLTNEINQIKTEKVGREENVEYKVITKIIKDEREDDKIDFHPVTKTKEVILKDQSNEEKIDIPAIPTTKLKKIENKKITINKGFETALKINQEEERDSRSLTVDLPKKDKSIYKKIKKNKNKVGKFPFKIKRERIKKRKPIKTIAAITLLLLIPIATVFASSPRLQKKFLGYSIHLESSQQVLGAKDRSPFDSDEQEDEYNEWMLEYNEKILDANEDSDVDGLTNIEEFYLKTNPISAYTCDENMETTDSQNLASLINPKTCEKIDFNNELEVEMFNKIMSMPNVQEKFLESFEQDDDNEASNSTKSLTDLFGVDDIGDVASYNIGDVNTDLEVAKTKQDYLIKIQKIDNYIAKYRSYDPFDRNYDTPVNPAVYLDVSIRYNTPLKYVMAIGRLESRYGTDRFTMDGNPTRIHQHRNIYSMGLDDAGNNWTFNDWESSVESFGKWYTKFEDRGVPNCTKWRIYNPNGDYCAKVEKLANEIDQYLNE